MSKIMIFDDDKDILDICSIILKAKGYKVFTETSCENVIEKIKACEPKVILMDNKIPETGGIAATRFIKQTESTKNIPVIFFSANTNVAQLSKEAEADYFLQKPFDITELENMIELVAGI
ncbi:response regulator [Panacibacter ginsenosidivorans]|uniref:Response regulator n=1 Tax=Panacibacter ginsenosidivorans TaxID=1813871 RepID=A0A5B8V9L6_9BACT|nr:response regulator [Panacibacter ginsenosidivorans]QEC68114.1 response regulator [Panacibacter ginsenosidivorans]